MTVYYFLWAGMFVLCTALGFLPEPTGAVRGLMTVLSVVFFVPPVLLLRTKQKQTVLLVRNLAALSLLFTAAALVSNILSALSTSKALGNFLYGLLAVVSCPMLCSGYWVLSLFLWAVLLLLAHRIAKSLP